MSKKKVIGFVIGIIVLTNIITFSVSSLVSLSFNNKVFVPTAEYNKLKQISKDYSKVIAIENYIENNYLRDTDDTKMLDGQLKGMLQSLEDPYSNYLNQDEFKSLLEQTSGTFGGIGVVVTPGEDNFITVVSPIEGTPGERAGIKSGDKIIKVEGKEYYGDTMDQAVKTMKGEPNTPVNLTLMRKKTDGTNEIIDLNINRELIRLVTVKSKIIEDAGDKVGYINLSSFDELTYDDFKAELTKFEKYDIEGLILDLRNNPGGLMDVCVAIADDLLGEGDIVYTQTKDGTRYYEKSNKAMVNYPLVVLVNGGSASASEILAGAIKDHNRGTIIGTTTFGKGVVQRIHGFEDGSGIKLTISEYFTPNGTNIHGIGIEPDIVVEISPEANIGVDNLNEDVQLKRAIEEIKSKSK